MENINVNDVIEGRRALFQLQKEYFLEHVLFATQWWLFVLMIIVLWVVWGVLVDKRRVGTILLVGLITSMLAITMDDIGISLSLWHYPYLFSPFISRLNAVDIAIIPVVYMLLYQYTKKWGSYLIVLVLITLFAILIAEPIFGALDMYIRLKWEYWYSGPIYIAMGIFVKWLVDKIARKEKAISENMEE